MLARSLRPSFLAVVLVPHSAAQCDEPAWLPGPGTPGIVSGFDAKGYLGASIEAAVRWDRDGIGPEEEVVVIGGSFHAAGQAVAWNLAAWDGATFSDVGGGVSGEVHALAARQDGRLVVGGRIDDVGGVPIANIAQWDGSNWTNLGLGTDDLVTDAVELADGRLVVGGDFTRAGGVRAFGIALWDGTTWHSLGDGLQSGPLGGQPLPGRVTDLLHLGGNRVAMVGGFTRAGDAPANGIATLEVAIGGLETTWAGLDHSQVGEFHTLALEPNGDLVCGGSFHSIGGISARNIARWDGTDWHAIGNGLDFTVLDVVAVTGSEVYAAGLGPVFPGSPVQELMRWDGMRWSAYGDLSALSPLVGDYSVQFIEALADGSLLAGPTAQNLSLARIAGGTYRPLASGHAGPVFALAVGSDGRIYTGMPFSWLGGTDAHGVAQYDGANWSGLGDGPGDGVAALAITHGDHVHALCVRLDPLGDVPEYFLRTWDGSNWTTTLQGVDIATIGSTNDDDLLIAIRSDFEVTVERWSAIGNIVLGGPFTANLFGAQIDAIIELPSGDIVVGGEFDQADGVPARSLARWDGQHWNSMGLVEGAGLQHAHVRDLAVAPNGDVIVAGDFVTLGGSGQGLQAALRWDGVQWSVIGDWPESSGAARVAVLGTGEVVVAINSSGGGNGGGFARVFDGTTWRDFGALNAPVADLCTLPNGDLALGGWFSQIDGAVSASFATFGCASVGVGYCSANPNSTGLSGELRGTGSAILAANRMELIASQLPPLMPAYFLTSLAAGLVVAPGGSSGDLCLDGAIGRFDRGGAPLVADANGLLELAIDLTAIPARTGVVAVVAGETRYFQTWYRDIVGGTPTSNFTTALAVQFH